MLAIVKEIGARHMEVIFLLPSATCWPQRPEEEWRQSLLSCWYTHLLNKQLWKFQSMALAHALPQTPWEPQRCLGKGQLGKELRVLWCPPPNERVPLGRASVLGSLACEVKGFPVSLKVRTADL